MSERDTRWLAWTFVVIAVLAAVVLGLMATGRLRVDWEWPGLLVGATLLAVLAIMRLR